MDVCTSAPRRELSRYILGKEAIQVRRRSTPTLILSLPIKSTIGKKQGLAELKLLHLLLFLTRDEFLLPLLTCFPAF